MTEPTFLFIDKCNVDLSALYSVARVGRTHGLKGELKFQPVNDREDQFAVGAAMILTDRFRKEQLEVHVESVQILEGSGIIRFREITDSTAARRFVNGLLLVPESRLIPLREGEYYIHDLIGLSVVDETHARIGTLTEVISQANHDVYEIEHAGRRSLIPAVEEFIRSIDLNSRTMTIRVIPGLLD